MRFTAVMLMLTNPDDSQSSYTTEQGATIERHSMGFCITTPENGLQNWFPDHQVRRAFWVLE